MPNDGLFQNLSTVQDNLQPGVTTLASAATVAPTTFQTILTGTVDITTITPPVSGDHLLVLIFTDASPGDILATGNVLISNTLVAQNSIVLAFYNWKTAKYRIKLLA